MAHSDFFLGEYSVISEIWSSLQISKLIRSQISYAIHDFVTVDQEIIDSDTTLNLSAVCCLKDNWAQKGAWDTSDKKVVG